MKQFEYKTYQGNISDHDLNVAGSKGWELVSHTAVVSRSGILNQYHIFKRQIVDVKPEEL